jgi:CheY-like chemotaxis protein
MIATSRPLRILIVDDSEDTVASCGELLILQGHDARAVERASEALTLLDEWWPDVALVDLRMPGMDGFELARWLRVQGDRCPLLVAVTGLGTLACRKRAAEVGFDCFFVKPLRLDVITDLLRRYSAYLSPDQCEVAHEDNTKTPV